MPSGSQHEEALALLKELFDTFDKDSWSLNELARATVSGVERDRLTGKASGVTLCRAKVGEMIRRVKGELHE